MVTTLRNQQADERSQRQQDSLNSRNLLMLLKHHVNVALGSDSYRYDTLPEALYLYGLHVLDNGTLLNMWCTTTAETIFRSRRIGQLRDGYEASFLALETNPLDDFTSVERIKLRVKQGQILQVTNK